MLRLSLFMDDCKLSSSLDQQQLLNTYRLTAFGVSPSNSSSKDGKRFEELLQPANSLSTKERSSAEIIKFSQKRSRSTALRLVI